MIGDTSMYTYKYVPTFYIYFDRIWHSLYELRNKHDPCKSSWESISKFQPVKKVFVLLSTLQTRVKIRYP
jgi:hypothetical protein